MTKPELAAWIGIGGTILMVIGLAKLVLFNSGWMGVTNIVLGAGCLAFAAGALTKRT